MVAVVGRAGLRRRRTEGGRPHRVVVRFTDEELARVVEGAEGARRTVPALLADLALTLAVRLSLDPATARDLVLEVLAVRRGLEKMGRYVNDIAREISYNLTITGLSVTVALGSGTIELVGVPHDKLALHDPISTTLAGVDLGNVGFLVVALFVIVWAAVVAFWKLGHVELRWALPTPTPSGQRRLGRDAPLYDRPRPCAGG